MPPERPEKIKFTRWREDMSLEEQIEFEKEQLQNKVANVNDARKLIELMKLGVANIATGAVENANATASFDEKLDFLFKALQEIVDLLGKKEISIDTDLKDCESQLKLIGLLQSPAEEEEAVEDSEDQILE